MQPKDYKKHLTHDETGDWLDNKTKKSTSKPREIENELFLRMVEPRDKLFYAEAEQAGNIERMDFLNNRHGWNIENGMLGVKSAKTIKIVHENEDALKRKSRHAEDNIVSAWGKWFKQTYPNIPYTIDKVAQQRSKLGGVIHKASQYQKGNPDIFIQSPKGGFAGCYIEQKKSEDIFYKGTRILKPGSDNQHIWQSLYHADLREQGYWVMFSISLESTKNITERYMAGNPYPMQVFEYYCKAEDYAIFEGNKHFKPTTNS